MELFVMFLYVAAIILVASLLMCGFIFAAGYASNKANTPVCLILFSLMAAAVIFVFVFACEFLSKEVL